MIAEAIGHALIVLAFFAGVSLLVALIMLTDPFIENPFDGWQKRRRARRENKGQPTFERLARAYEREAEENIADGKLERARNNLREARKIRTDATEAMISGKEPPL